MNKNLKEFVNSYLLETISKTVTPSSGSSSQEVADYLNRPQVGHFDGSDGVTQFYVIYKPKATINALLKARWNHKSGGLDRGGIPKSDEYTHPDKHTVIKHKPGSTEFKVHYKDRKKIKRNIDYSLPGHYD